MSNQNITLSAEIGLGANAETISVVLKPGDRLIVGRGPADEDEMLLPVQGRLTSRRHAAFTWNEGRLFVEDLDSANGVLVNGESIPPGQPRAIAADARIEVGDALITVAQTERSGWQALAERSGVTPPSSTIAAYLEEEASNQDDAPPSLSLVADANVELVIGRAYEVDLTLGDPAISRRHLRLGESVARDPVSPFVAEDLESTRGSWLNGRRLVAPAPLEHGDLLHFGHFTARVLIETIAGSPRLAVTIRRVGKMARVVSGEEGRTLHIEKSTAKRGDRAPRWEPTSDLRRPSRWLLPLMITAAILIAGVVVGAVQPQFGISSADSGPGPLSAPHQRAGLECADCHQPAGLTVASPERGAACKGCHGEHPSVRPGHAKAMADGALACADCHTVHRQMEGIDFHPDGDWTWWRTGAESVTGESSGYQPTERQTVVLVPLADCSRCHDPSSDLDPIQRCAEPLATDVSNPGDAFSLCFDEHQQHAEPGVAVSAVSSPQHNIIRPAAWEAARHVTANLEQRPEATVGPDRNSSAGYWWFAAALILPLLFVALRRPRQGFLPDSSQQGRSSVELPDDSRGQSKSQPQSVEPAIDPLTCLGCSACIDACPYDVLALENYVAHVVNNELCCGVGSCADKCPNGSLTLKPAGDAEELVPLRLTLESQLRRGIYVAGDLTGLPLIKNAINQGAAAIDAISDDLSSAPDAEGNVDVAIIGAGPAGLSAALAAQRAGLSYRLLEQGEVAQSIQNFPRGKLVFDQPLSIPVVGDLWLEEATKEELLRHWRRIIRDEGIEVSTFWRLSTVEDDPDSEAIGFRLQGTDPRTGATRDGFSARRILLCVGRRGSPRKLDVTIPQSAEPHVHYSLADALSFAGQRCLIVGMGDVAMETAIALANQPGTKVVMSYRRSAFHSGSRRNQRTVAELERAGVIEIQWSTEVDRILDDSAVLRSTEAESDGLEPQGDETETQKTLPDREIPWDAIFVMIGGIPPTSLLAGMHLVRETGTDPR